MRKVATVVLVVGFLANGDSPAQQATLEQARSRLPCLAPLIWRWEKGEFPLSMGEAFFRGPYHFREFEEVPEDAAIPFPVAGLEGDHLAQRYFEKGVALLHGFRDREAERAFRQVVTLAPDCAMGYWGLALANGRSPGRARLFAAEAEKRLGPNPEDAEKLWVGWVANFFADDSSLGDEERRRRAVRDLELLVRRSPGDPQVRAFLVRQVVLNELRGGLEIRSRLAIDRLIAGILDEQPGFPVRNYRILLWLNDRPEMAAMILSKGWPQAGSIGTAEDHRFLAEHFLARALPDRALPLFEKGAAMELAWLNESGRMPGESALLPELVGRWIETLGAMGRVEDAKSAAVGAAALRRNPHLRRNLGSNQAVADVRAEAQRALLQTWIDWGLWDRVIDYGISDQVSTGTYADTVWNFDRIAAVGVAEQLSGSRDALATRLARLEKLREDLPGTMRGRTEADQFAESVIAELKHFRHFCEDGGTPAKEYRFIGKGGLARICRERKGLQLVALEFAEADLKERPGVFEAKANAAAMRFRSGKTKEAVFLMDREFRRQAGRVDPDLPVMKELARVAEVLKLPEDWTLPTDEMKVRNLPAKGLLEWPDPKAPDWTLMNWRNEAVNLSDFGGKPVLLVFFLGGGCLHCVEQLTNLVPRAPQFAAAGIPIVTISTESVDLLSKTLGKEPDPGKAFPFEIVSDQALEIFKAYGVFDEFEKRALHGTFLLDPEGRILWRELSHEPFQHPDFLLKESRRLLEKR